MGRLGSTYDEYSALLAELGVRGFLAGRAERAAMAREREETSRSRMEETERTKREEAKAKRELEADRERQRGNAAGLGLLRRGFDPYPAPGGVGPPTPGGLDALGDAGIETLSRADPSVIAKVFQEQERASKRAELEAEAKYRLAKAEQGLQVSMENLAAIEEKMKSLSPNDPTMPQYRALHRQWSQERQLWQTARAQMETQLGGSAISGIYGEDEQGQKPASWSERRGVADTSLEAGVFRVRSEIESLQSQLKSDMVSEDEIPVVQAKVRALQKEEARARQAHATALRSGAEYQPQEIDVDSVLRLAELEITDPGKARLVRQLSARFPEARPSDIADMLPDANSPLIIPAINKIMQANPDAGIFEAIQAASNMMTEQSLATSSPPATAETPVSPPAPEKPPAPAKIGKQAMKKLPEIVAAVRSEHPDWPREKQIEEARRRLGGAE